MRKDTFAGCANLRRMEVAEGCKLGMKYYVPPTVEIVTVPRAIVVSEEPSSDPDAREAGSKAELPANAEEDNDEPRELRE